MSYRVRIIISEATDETVLYAHQVEGTGDYRQIPELFDQASNNVRRELLRIGAYGLANAGFPGRDD